jgi:hypothetical protein
MLNSDTEVRLIGILFLRFTDDGRCAELRETWLFEAGDHAPHDGWGDLAEWSRAFLGCLDRAAVPA